MRLLLDTQIFIWSVTADRRLTAVARTRIAAADSVFVSAASIWEIAIKARLGKISGSAEVFAAAIEDSGFQALAVTTRHAAAVAKLPLHHADPFDRLLVAQAFDEPLRLLTAHAVLAAYGGGVTVL